MFGAILAITIFLQALIVELAGSFALTTGLTVGQWFSCLGIAAVTLPLGVLIRLIPIPKSKQELQGSQPKFLLQEESVEMD
jgi:Ca2+-transporting ATPase